MKTTIKVVLGAILFGALLGAAYGLWMTTRRSWDSSLENVETIKKERAQEAAAAKAVVDEAKSEKSKFPRVETPEIEYDFGVLEKNDANEKGSHDFVIKNVGTGVLKLTEKDKSCFCTEFHIEKKSLPPGEQTICRVTWDGKRGGGDFKQSVLIGTNDPLAKEIFFNVKGLYNSPVVCNPNQLAFNGVQNTREETREFHLLGFGKTESGEPIPLEITDSILSDPEHFVLTLEKGTPDQMTEEEKKNKVLSQATSLYRGTLTLKPGMPQGSFQEEIQFRTNNASLPILEVMLEGQITGTITISGTHYDKHETGQVVIGPVSSRKTTLEKIRLTVLDPTLIADEETFKVVSARPDWLKINLRYPDKEAQKTMPVKILDVEIEIPAGSPQGKFSGPSLGETGEIILKIGPQQLILPVNFAVGP